jgi:hypothetical protein
MRVRILSGNEKGQVKDMPQTEAEVNISTGFAELADPKKDQATLDANVADVPKVPKKEAERLVERSPSAKPKKGKTGKVVPPKAPKVPKTPKKVAKRKK